MNIHFKKQISSILCDAVRNGDINKVEMLLEQNELIPWTHMGVCIYDSVTLGFTEITKMLLEHFLKNNILIGLLYVHSFKIPIRNDALLKIWEKLNKIESYDISKKILEKHQQNLLKQRSSIAIDIILKNMVDDFFEHFLNKYNGIDMKILEMADTIEDTIIIIKFSNSENHNHFKLTTFGYQLTSIVLKHFALKNKNAIILDERIKSYLAYGIDYYDINDLEYIRLLINLGIKFHFDENTSSPRRLHNFTYIQPIIKLIQSNKNVSDIIELLFSNELIQIDLEVISDSNILNADVKLLIERLNKEDFKNAFDYVSNQINLISNEWKHIQNINIKNILLFKINQLANFVNFIKTKYVEQKEQYEQESSGLKNILQTTSFLLRKLGSKHFYKTILVYSNSIFPKDVVSIISLYDSDCSTNENEFYQNKYTSKLFSNMLIPERSVLLEIDDYFEIKEKKEFFQQVCVSFTVFTKNLLRDTSTLKIF